MTTPSHPRRKYWMVCEADKTPLHYGCRLCQNPDLFKIRHEEIPQDEDIVFKVFVWPNHEEDENIREIFEVEEGPMPGDYHIIGHPVGCKPDWPEQPPPVPPIPL